MLLKKQSTNLLIFKNHIATEGWRWENIIEGMKGSVLIAICTK